MRADLQAARLLDSLLYDAWVRGSFVSLDELCALLEARHVCVYGGSVDVERAAPARDCEVIVSADGVTELLLEYGLTPHVVFTDLDGRLGALLRAAGAGSLVVVHGHGDNVAQLRYLVPLLGRVHGTVQALPPSPTKFVTVLGGFTDGDRAVAAAVFCRARRVTLYGMSFGMPVSRYSKPWLRGAVRPWPEKRAKLLWGARLVSFLLRVGSALGIEISWSEDDEGILRR